MAQCKLSPQDFIKNAFTPQIAVMCSPSVDKICQKNNLTFVELVQPFCKLSADAYLQDTNGGVVTIHNLKITLIDVNFRPPQPTLARKFLNASVSQALEPRSQTVQVGEYDLDIPASTPWFEAWRDTFLQVQFPSDHEFTKHFLACIVVVSSTEPNPVDAMNQLNQHLNQMQNIMPNKLPKWFSSYILRYFVIVHDNSDGDHYKANQALEALKVSFGISNCFLLRMNSRPPGQVDEQLPDPWSQYVSNSFENEDGVRASPESSPSASRLFTEVGQESVDSGNTLPYHPLSPDTEPQSLNDALLENEAAIELQPCNTVHGMCLTTEDVEQIKLLIHEFCTRALLPYVERQIQNLTEIVSNKKGVSKSLFSATKRWFTPSKMGTNNGSSNAPIYTPDAPELQMRKLGDLYFMFCHYTLAFQVYHAAKRDFNSDQAWFYYAGALEMAGLAAFMANESTRKTCDYIEEGIVTYLNICKMAQFATRATLLSSECLKGRNLHGEAAHQLIRMTSEESDLRSALLLEQAAYSFLNCSRPQMVRKYAFHMVLAGHRFSKAAQKKHALRCYKQALQVYRCKGWTFAEDHVHYTIGKLSSGLNVLEEAANSFSMLISIQSKQSVEQQTLFLKEYLSSQRMLLTSLEYQQMPVLLLPVLESESTRILVGPTPPLSIPGKVRALGVSLNTCDDAATAQKWNKLEEMLVQEAQGSLPLLFKPVITLYTRHNINNTNLIAIVNEPIQVFIKLHNPLAVTLNLKDLFLFWTFKDSNGSIMTNEISSDKTDSFLKTHVIKSVAMQVNSMQEFILSVTPLIVGELQLKGIFYSIVNPDMSGEEIVVAGKQLLDISKLGLVKKDSQTTSQEDLGLPISIMPPAPCLQVTFCEIHTELLCSQIQPVSIEMRNVGSGPLHKVYVCTSTPEYLSTCEFHRKSFHYKDTDDIDTPAVREREARKNHVAHVPLPNGSLEPGHSHSVNIWLKAPDTKGSVVVDLLIYYENNDSKSIPRYRLIRHQWNLVIHESLAVDLTVSEGCKSEGVKELLFSIKAVNMNKLYYSMLTEITLLKAGLLSSSWKLELLDNIKSKNAISITSQQSAYILLRGQRHITENSKYYDVPLGSKSVSSRTTAAYLDFARRLEQTRINIFDDNSVTKKPKDREGILFFQWNARIIDNAGARHKASGQSYITIENVMVDEEKEADVQGEPIVLYDPNKSLDLQATENENGVTMEELRTQVSMCIIHSSHVYHDFTKNKLCVIPVKISLHNDSNVSSLVTVNTSGTNSASPPSSSRPNLFYPYPSKDYRWVGFSGTVKTIAPLNSEVIMLYAAVSSPGVYDLGRRLEHWCQNDLHSQPILQVLRALCFLTVINTNH